MRSAAERPPQREPQDGRDDQQQDREAGADHAEHGEHQADDAGDAGHARRERELIRPPLALAARHAPARAGLEAAHGRAGSAASMPEAYGPAPSRSAPSRSRVDTTVANSSWRLVAVARVSSSAVMTVPSGPSRSKVAHASSTNSTSYPRFPPIRAVVSTQWLVVMPHSAKEAMPRPRSHASRSGAP